MEIEQPKTRVSFYIPGDAPPKGSKNVGRNGHVYEVSKRLAPWNELAEELLLEARGSLSTRQPPYRVSVGFGFQRPKKATYNWPVSVDLDKACRALGDVLQKTGVVVDDKHIIVWDATKFYSREGFTRGWIESIKGYEYA